jgi:hypothetical protein
MCLGRSTGATASIRELLLQLLQGLLQHKVQKVLRVLLLVPLRYARRRPTACLTAKGAQGACGRQRRRGQRRREQRRKRCAAYSEARLQLVNRRQKLMRRRHHQLACPQHAHLSQIRTRARRTITSHTVGRQNMLPSGRQASRKAKPWLIGGPV